MGGSAMSSRKRDILIIGAIGIAFTIFISVIGVIDMDKAPVFTLVLYAGLIVVTMFYIYYSMEIASAAREQADATVRMAEQAREQRYSESLPLLVPTITTSGYIAGLAPDEVGYVALQMGAGLKVTYHNEGRGVAINLKFSFWAVPMDDSPGKVFFFGSPELKALGIGNQVEIGIREMGGGQLQDIPPAYHPHIIVEYQDIYGRKITTVQEFRIDEQNKRAFLGELYFTVNGKRLGEEVVRHD
jgi:hypothetical protein